MGKLEQEAAVAQREDKFTSEMEGILTAQYGEVVLKITALNLLASQFSARNVLVYSITRLAHLLETAKFEPKDEVAALKALCDMACKLNLRPKGATETARDPMAAIRNGSPPLVRERGEPRGH